MTASQPISLQLGALAGSLMPLREQYAKVIKSFPVHIADRIVNWRSGFRSPPGHAKDKSRIVI